MSLIAGMDDIIAYIKKLEDENKKMKNGFDDIFKVFKTPSSKSYTTKIKEAIDIINQFKVEDNKSVIDYKKLKEENEVLKEENKELKEKIDDASYREDSMFQTLNKKRKEESDWAQKKIEELKFFNRDCKEETERFMEENKKLKEEIEPLRQLKKEADEECECMVSVMMKKCMDDIDEKHKQFQKELQEECITTKNKMNKEFANTVKEIISCLFEMKDYELSDFVDKLNYVGCQNSNIDVVEICDLCNIELVSDEGLRELYNECGEETEEFFIDNLGYEKGDTELKEALEYIKENRLPRDHPPWEMDLDEEEFIEWYLNKEYSEYHYDCNSDYYFCIS